MDFFNRALQFPSKMFKWEILSLIHKCIIGNPEKRTKDQIVITTHKHFMNMHSIITWEKEKAGTDQIIALTTKIDYLEKNLEATETTTLAMSKGQ